MAEPKYKVGDEIWFYNYWSGLPEPPEYGTVTECPRYGLIWVDEDGFERHYMSNDSIFFQKEEALRKYKEDLLEYKSYIENQLRLVNLNIECFPKSWIKEELKRIKHEEKS